MRQLKLGICHGGNCREDYETADSRSCLFDRLLHFLSCLVVLCVPPGICRLQSVWKGWYTTSRHGNFRNRWLDSIDYRDEPAGDAGSHASNCGDNCRGNRDLSSAYDRFLRIAAPAGDNGAAAHHRLADGRISVLPKRLTKLLKDHFRAGAAIVNISSSRDRMSQPQSESYTAAKGGIAVLTHALAVSLSGKVRVNSISPGWIETGDTVYSGPDAGQHPAGRVGRPEDIAEMVLFLCSEKAGKRCLTVRPARAFHIADWKRPPGKP